LQLQKVFTVPLTPIEEITEKQGERRFSSQELLEMMQLKILETSDCHTFLDFLEETFSIQEKNQATREVRSARMPLVVRNDKELQYDREFDRIDEADSKVRSANFVFQEGKSNRS